MPKDKNSRSRTQKVRDYTCRPYPSPDLGSVPLSEKSFGEDEDACRIDWENMLCPVCMETPHNAVLLRCSSYENGCRPYICDTSYRHSNCFDQYLKAHLASMKLGSRQHVIPVTRSGHFSGESFSGLRSAEQETYPESGSSGTVAEQEGFQAWRVGARRVSKSDLLGLACPLCRGNVEGCEVVKRVRDVLNSQARVCAKEACFFSGSYKELRVHARIDHPLARPAEIDPARQRSWVRMEQRRELGDVLSAIHASVPHATVAGDYAIDGEDTSAGNVEPSLLSEDGHFSTVFLSFQLFGSMHPYLGGTPLPLFRGVLRRHRRSGSSRHGLWGEIMQHGQSTETSGDFGANMIEYEGHWDRMNRRWHR